MRSVLVLCLIGIPLWAAPAPKRIGPEFWEMPWGIVDRQGRIGYLTNREGHVEAVDLRSGKVKWEWSPVPPFKGRSIMELQNFTAKLSQMPKPEPLALVNGKLAVQACGMKNWHLFHVVLLKDGKPVWQSRQVNAGGEFCRAQHRCCTSAWFAEGALYIRWASHSEKENVGWVRGVVKADMKTGRLINLQRKNTPAPPQPCVPNTLAREARFRVTSPFGTDWRITVSRKHAVGITVEGTDHWKSARLYRWDLASAKRLPPIVLLEGRVLKATLSVDGEVVFIYKPTEGANKAVDGYWILFSTATGKSLGKRADNVGTIELTSLGSRLFAIVKGPALKGRQSNIVDRELHAFELKTGKFLWKRPLEGRSW